MLKLMRHEAIRIARTTFGQKRQDVVMEDPDIMDVQIISDRYNARLYNIKSHS